MDGLCVVATTSGMTLVEAATKWGFVIRSSNPFYWTAGEPLSWVLLSCLECPQSNTRAKAGVLQRLHFQTGPSFCRFELRCAVKLDSWAVRLLRGLQVCFQRTSWRFVLVVSLGPYRVLDGDIWVLLALSNC